MKLPSIKKHPSVANIDGYTLTDERILEIAANYFPFVGDSNRTKTTPTNWPTKLAFAHGIIAELDKKYEPLVAELEIVEQAKKCYPRDGIIKAIEQTRIDNENSEYIKNILDNPPTFAKLEQED